MTKRTSSSTGFRSIHRRRPESAVVNNTRGVPAGRSLLAVPRPIDLAHAAPNGGEDFVRAEASAGLSGQRRSVSGLYPANLRTLTELALGRSGPRRARR